MWGKPWCLGPHRMLQAFQVGPGETSPPTALSMSSLPVVLGCCPLFSSRLTCPEGQAMGQLLCVANLKPRNVLGHFLTMVARLKEWVGWNSCTQGLTQAVG